MGIGFTKAYSGEMGMSSYSRISDVPGILLLTIVVSLGWLVIMPAAGLAQQGTTDLLQQGQAYENQQNYPAAEDIYRRVLATDPDNPEALKHLGMLEQNDLKFSESIEHFKRVLADQP